MDIGFPSAPLVVTTVLLLAAATVTDVRSRRIPNVLTFPATAAGLAIRSFQDGGSGLLVAAAGCVSAPAVLLVLRGFRLPGMGDLKLAMAVGALLGPAAGALAMLVSAIAGGLLALGFAFRPGTSAARSLGPFFTGIPWLGRLYGAADGPETPAATITVPYGAAIAVGSLLTLGIVRWS